MQISRSKALTLRAYFGLIINKPVFPSSFIHFLNFRHVKCVGKRWSPPPGLDCLYSTNYYYLILKTFFFPTNAWDHVLEIIKSWSNLNPIAELNAYEKKRYHYWYHCRHKIQRGDTGTSSRNNILLGIGWAKKRGEEWERDPKNRFIDMAKFFEK